MSKIGEQLLTAINKVMPDTHQALLTAKETPEKYQAFFAARAESSFARFGELDFSDQTVLDVGCGLGANLGYLVELGSHAIIGADISVSQIQATQSVYRKHFPQTAAKIRFLGADASLLPFADDSFDTLVAADTFEHVEDLDGTLRECARVTKPGGKLLVYFPPFYAPWGAHMINWIQMPWCQIFFSEQTILNVARQLEAEGKSINSQLPQETRLNIQSATTIPFVNHITVSYFFKLLKDNPDWQVVKVRLLPPNWRSDGWLSKVVGFLNYFPFLREAFTAKALFILEKSNDMGK